jgi:hypothetical protein
MNAATGLARFWDLAEPLLAQPGIERSTMMGLPCLRVHGAFFASCDRRSGDLLVKLPQQRVDELVAAGRVHAFAPAGAGSASGRLCRPSGAARGAACSTTPSRSSTGPPDGRTAGLDTLQSISFI